jgi:hypothetical protein
MSSALFDLEAVPPVIREECAEINERMTATYELIELTEELNAHFRATGEGELQLLRVAGSVLDRFEETRKAQERLAARINEIRLEAE